MAAHYPNGKVRNDRNARDFSMISKPGILFGCHSTRFDFSSADIEFDKIENYKIIREPIFRKLSVLLYLEFWPIHTIPLTFIKKTIKKSKLKQKVNFFHL